MARAPRDFPALGPRLLSARLQRGYSQATVARRAGVAASYVSRIENGRVQPTVRTLQRIARAIGVPSGELAWPAAVAEGGHACPVTEGGKCLLDLIRIDAANGAEEAFTPRQVALLRRFAAWLRNAQPDRQQAMRILLDDLSRSPLPRC